VLNALVRSTARVDVVLGSAGAGKTVMLAALHDHYATQRVPVVGACLAAVTARRLEHATGIPSTSVARLAGRIRDGHPLPERCVLVVDEAGMVGTRHYATLLAEIARIGGKLVAVGDRAQLTEIDAGGMFAQLSRSYRRGELADNHRQIEPWERDALTALRNGELFPAWKAYRDHGRLHRHVDHDTLRARIAEQYLQSLGDGASPLDVVALTGTRRDAQELNAHIRERLQQHGRLGADQPVGPGALAVGELVLVTRNDNPRGLLNGTRGIVTAITARHVQLRLDDRRDVTVPAGWAAERLRPAYAMTVHKAQGLTVDVALVDTTALPDRNAGYVAFSRARQRTEIHHTGTAEMFRNLADDPLTDVFIDVDRNVTDLRRLRRHREQQLAVHQALPTWMTPTPARSYDPYEHDRYLHHHRDNDRDFGRGR
jgi:ATP-dependent exoDNAse (exonuclease V) alpha subunit